MIVTKEEIEISLTLADFMLVCLFFFFVKIVFFLIKLLGNVNRYVREKDIRDLFSRYGRIRDLILRVSCNYE